MSNLNIACLLSPMADTEGPMDIANGNTLTGAKKIMGKYGEVGLEATITFGENHPNQIHTDILSIGKAKEVTSIQQTAIAMIQPAKHPGTLGVHALNLENVDEYDGFAIADMLAQMVNQLENKPDLVFAGRESWDYAHGIVGPALAQKLGYPFYSGVNEIALNEDLKSVTATFIEGNDKVVFNIALPAVFGTTDWLNGKDSARFTSLKGVMMAKKFKRTTVEGIQVDPQTANRTEITGIEPVKSERKNRRLEDGEGSAKVTQALDILVSQDKALNLNTSADSSNASSQQDVPWTTIASGSVDLSNDVIVIADHDGHQVRQSTLKTLGLARKIANDHGKSVSLVAFAESHNNLGNSAAGHGADKIVCITNPSFKYPSVETVSSALEQIANQPKMVFSVANDLGRDLASFLAAKYNGGLLQDVVGLDSSDLLKATRIVSNARFQTQEKILPSAEAQFISVRASAFDAHPEERATAFEHMALSDLDSSAKLLEVVAGAEIKGIPLNEAKIIFSGGRGMKASENFQVLNELAANLNGAVGASRAVTDLEWVPHNLQIGQTGTTVAPDVYFAVGISGAIQHLTGMLGSKYIVAINHDGDAPIHKHADLSIIDKWENILPSLNDQIKAMIG